MVLDWDDAEMSGHVSPSQSTPESNEWGSNWSHMKASGAFAVSDVSGYLMVYSPKTRRFPVDRLLITKPDLET